MLLQNILLIATCFILIALAIRTGKNLKISGMPAFFAMIVSYFIWVVGNLIEQASSQFDWMLWGRNITQIGVFFTPLCTLYFSVSYSSNQKLLKIAHIIGVIQVVSVLLIFTDQMHHIMRERVQWQQGALFGQAIVVQSTKIGSALVAFNFSIPLISVANLVLFTRTVNEKLRRPLWQIIISIFATFVIAAVQSTILNNLGIIIPIPVLNLPCIILFSYAVLRGGFVGVTPTALHKVFEVIDQGIVVVDEAGSVIEYNRRAAELMNEIAYADCLQIGASMMDLVSDKKTSPHKAFSMEAIPAEYKNTQRNKCISLVCHPLEAFKRKLIGYVIVLTDITLLKIRSEIDSLTGSYNREGLTNAFLDMQKETNSASSLSAMILDLDDFKRINDTYGHLGGDIILRDLVSTAQALLSEKHILGRLGGDEFVVILPGSHETAINTAERLRACVSQKMVQYMDHKIRYTISIGIASCTAGDCSFSDLLHKADMALYNAKHHGKNAINYETQGAVPIKTQEAGTDAASLC